MTTKKPPKKPVDPDWGRCSSCGALTAWPGEDVACDETEDCDGVYIPSDENGVPL